VLDGDKWSASHPGRSNPKRGLEVVNMFVNVRCIMKLSQLYGYIQINLMLFVNVELVFI